MSEQLLPPPFSTALHRLEVGTAPNEELDEGVIWSVHLAQLAKSEDVLFPCVVATAYLSRNGPEGFGQVQAAGMIWNRDIAIESQSKEAWSSFLDELQYSYVEAIYDTARRALQSQAAQMDFSFDLDPKAPPTDLHVYEPEPEEVPDLN